MPNNSINNPTSVGNEFNGIYNNNEYLMTNSHPNMPSMESSGPRRELHYGEFSMPRTTNQHNRILNDAIREFRRQVESEHVSMGRGITIPNYLYRPSIHESVSQEAQNPPSDSIVINLDNIVPNNQGENPNSNDNANNNDDASGTDTLRNVIEAQQSLVILQKYFPFLLILVAKGLYDHCEGIFNLIILLATFIHANSVVKREATKQTRRSLSKLFIALLYIVACFVFIGYVFEDEKIYLNLVFIPPYKQPATVWTLLWTVGLTDFILKLITIIFKIVLTMLPGKIVLFQRRGKIYLFIEAVSQLYRSLATIQPWLYYLLESYKGAEKIVGVFLSAAYMVSKGTDLMCRLRLFKMAVLKLLQNVTLGSLPSKDQIQTAGNSCPICHDEYDSPVLLQCRHIFCESCVSTWFDREQTCPLCRAKIVDDPSWRDGSTTFFIQLF